MKQRSVDYLCASAEWHQQFTVGTLQIFVWGEFLYNQFTSKKHQDTLMRTNKQSAYFNTNRKYISEEKIKEMAEHVEQNLNTLYESHFKHHFNSKLECYKKCLLFITVVFNQRAISITQNEFGRTRTGKHPLDECKWLQFDTLKRIHGNNLNRKTKAKPALFAFIDYEGSKMNASNGPADIRNVRNPHVHAIALVPPQIGLKYQIMIADQFGRDRRINTIQSVLVKQYDPDKASVSHLISYCMKGLKGFTEEQVQWLEMRLPGSFA